MEPGLRRVFRISRQFSLGSVMESILQGGPISRVSIAKQTGLSKQTISEIVRHLEEEGWVIETGRTGGHVGRTAATYEIIPDAAYIVAVDLGGTQVHVGIVDLTGHVAAEAAELTDRRGGFDVIDQIARICLDTAGQGGIAKERLRLAVVGVPGAPQMETGRVLMAPNIPGFDTMDVVAALEAALGFGVILENDVNLAVQGEAWLGAGQGLDDLAFVALGTGIGSGMILAGELVHGADNAAGEMGFLPFGADPFEPESLRVGAFERQVASAGIRRRYAARSGEELEVPEIFERAGAGDTAASEVLDETARLLARGIAAICALANPSKVILGGSIGSRPELLDRLRAVLPLCLPVPVTVEPSRLGTRAALVGAAAIGLSQLHNALFGAEAPGGRISLPPAPPLRRVAP